MKISECISQLNFNIEYNKALGSKYANLFVAECNKFKPFQKLFNDVELVFALMSWIGMVYQIIMINKGFYIHNIALYVLVFITIVDNIFLFYHKRNLKKAKKAYAQCGKASIFLLKYKDENESRDLTENEIKKLHNIIGDK